VSTAATTLVVDVPHERSHGSHRPYDEYAHAELPGISAVPGHWTIQRADAVLDYRKSLARQDEFADEDVFHYSIPVIQETGSGQVESGAEIGSDKLALEGGEILVSKLNPRKGVVLIAEPHELKVVCSSEFVPLIPRACDRRFAFWLYASEFVRSQISSVVQSVTRSHQRARPEHITKIRLPFPPLPEQRAIAAFLDRQTEKVDTLIEKKKRLVELLEEKRTAMITRAVTKGLNPDAPMKDSGVEWLGEVPAHWEIHRLKAVAACKFSNVDKHFKEEETPVELCNYTDVYYNRGIPRDHGFMGASATDEEISRFGLREGDVLITKDSESPNDIAIPALIQFTDSSVLCGYHLAQIRSRRGYVVPEFLLFLFSSKLFRGQLEAAANGITRFGLTQSAVRNAQLPLPPLDEQEEIASTLEALESRVQRIRQSTQSTVSRLREYRSALISAAVTGQIDVRDEVAA
jgi:type I restriction enzyme, S subunit